MHTDWFVSSGMIWITSEVERADHDQHVYPSILALVFAEAIRYIDLGWGLNCYTVVGFEERICCEK